MDPLDFFIDRQKKPPFIGSIVNINNNGTAYDVLVGNRDYPYEGVRTNCARENAQHSIDLGNWENVVHIWGDVNLPVILALPFTGGGSAANTAPIPPGGLPINITIKSGMWIEMSGFWWTGNIGIFNCKPLQVPLQTITVTETFTGSTIVPPNPSHSPPILGSFPLPAPTTPTILYNNAFGMGYGGQKNALALSLTNLPIPGHFESFKLLNVVITTANLVPPGPFDFTTFFQTLKITGSPPLFPGILVTSNEIGSVPIASYTIQGGGDQLPIITLINVPDVVPGTPPAGPTFNMSDITTVAITYSYQVNAVPIQDMDSGSGPDTAISPRGMAMFPNTSHFGNNHQILGALMADYAALGGEPIPTKITQELSYVTGAVGVELAHTPTSIDLNPIFFANSFNDFGFLFDFAYYAIGNILYAICISEQTGITANGEIDIIYETISGSSTSYQDFFTGDGTTFVFQLTQPIDPTTKIDAAFDNVNGNYSFSLDWTTNLITFIGIPPVGANIEVDYEIFPHYTQTDAFTFGGVGGGLPMVDQQTMFTLTQVPVINTISVPNFNTGNGFNFNGDQGNALVLVPLVSGDTEQDVRFAITHTGGDGGNSYISYIYDVLTGHMFNITGQFINEYDVTNTELSILELPYPYNFDATPYSKFFNMIASGTPLTLPGQPGVRWQTGWQYQRWGFLFYDPVNDCYTAVTPVGIFWRSRVVGSVLGTHYTFMPWPVEDACEDPSFMGWSYPDDTQDPKRWLAGTVGVLSKTGMLRRGGLGSTDFGGAMFGTGFVSIRGLQGSWGTVGEGTVAQKILLAPQEFGGGVGVPSDSDFKIRFLQRNTSNVVTVLAEVSVLDLPQDVEGPGRLYIPACGLVNLDAVGGYATNRPDPGFGVKNSYWPASKDASAWLIGCGWCVADWLKDVSSFNTKANFTNMPFGTDDAGFTLQMRDAVTGQLLDRITYKCNPEIIEYCYDQGDLDTQNVYNLVQAAGQPVVFNVPYQLQANANYGSDGGPGGSYSPPYGFCAHFFQFTDYDSVKIPILKNPGIPFLANGEPRYSSQNYGQKGSEDAVSFQRISGDGNDNFCFCLGVPEWARTMNTVLGDATKSFTGNSSFTIDHYSGDMPTVNTWIINEIITGPGSQWQWLITGVDNATFANLPCSANYSTGFSTASKEYLGFVSFSPDRSLQTVTGPFYLDPPDDTEQYFHVERNGGELKVAWHVTTPNLELCTFSQFIPFPSEGYDLSSPYSSPPLSYAYPVTVPSIATFVLTNIIGTAGNFLNFEGPLQGPASSGLGLPGSGPFSPEMPGPDMFIAGGIKWNFSGDNRANYLQTSRTFLKKCSYNKTTRKLSELWSVDVSVMAKITSNLVVGNTTILAQPVPKYIKVPFTEFVGRYIAMLRLPEPVNNVLYLEVWDNAATAPNSYRFIVPLTGMATYKDLEMVQGIDSENNEWILVSCTTTDGATYGKWLVRFKTNQALPPAMQFSSLADDGIPSVFNMQGITFAADNYFWSDEAYSIFYRIGTE